MRRRSVLPVIFLLCRTFLIRILSLRRVSLCPTNVAVDVLTVLKPIRSPLGIRTGRQSV